MWQIDNRTPFSAGQGWVRDLEGAETWLVVVKATFDIQPDGSTLPSPEQPPPTRAPVYRGEPNVSSVIYENDFVLGKQKTDLVVNGTARAPYDRPVTTLDVGVQVAQIRKVVRVSGNRTWGPAGAWLSDPEPFVAMPVTYERAFGGVDPASPRPEIDFYWPNPVGTGFCAARDRIAGRPAPNIEYRDQPVTSWDSRPAPAGLGVIGSHWQERAAFAGTYDDAWAASRQPLLPGDFDFHYFQTVPADQQATGLLQGGESVALLNLTSSPTSRFSLPHIELAMETTFKGGRRVEHAPPSLHTVIIEPDQARVSLVFHSAMQFHAHVYQLEKTRVEQRSPDASDDEEEVGDLLDLV